MGQSPAQPQSDQYSLDNLQLYPRYTRASYFAAFGVEPAPFQVAQPIKRWALPAGELAGKAPYDLFIYRYVDAASGQYRQNAGVYDLAGRLNLPGATNYPKYVIAATRAVAVTPDPFGGDLRNAINPDYLSNKTDADRLASELNAGAPFEPVVRFGAISYRSDESRRGWSVNRYAVRSHQFRRPDPLPIFGMRTWPASMQPSERFRR